jgi:hypothetical protein
MRLVFVNHAHPDVAHVSGMRFGAFARSMAERGHEVVLLTSTLPGGATIVNPSNLRDWIASHDWHSPLTLAISPRHRSDVPASLPRPLARLVTLGRFVAHSGVHDDWTTAVQPLVHGLASAFQPDVVLGTFGNTSNLSLAQRLAQASGCPWVIDVKDNWSTFLRPGVRELMAWRFRDAAGFTSNATHHRDIASKWLWQRRDAVVYSGVAAPFFEATGPEVTARTEGECPAEFLLIGSTYDRDRLREFLRVVHRWVSGLPVSDRGRVAFVYAGSDHERVSGVLDGVALPCRVEVLPQLPLSDLANRCRQSFANCYLWAAFTFHQKLLELLACGRPVITFPGEASESIQLASSSTTSFSACAGADEVHEALTHAWTNRARPPANNQHQPWKWSDRACRLESFLGDLVQRTA